MKDINKDFITEPEKRISVIGKYDVVVSGGNKAGLEAAIKVAHEGAKTLLIVADNETVKFTDLEMADSAGVTLMLHTHVSDMIVEGDKVKGVLIESKFGRQAVLANQVIDCRT